MISPIGSASSATYIKYHPQASQGERLVQFIYCKALSSLEWTRKAIWHDPLAPIMHKLRHDTDKCSAVTEAIAYLVENRNERLSILLKCVLNSASEEMLKKMMQDIISQAIETQDGAYYNLLLEHLDLASMEKILPEEIRITLQNLVKHTRPVESESLGRKEWKKVSTMFTSFIPNLVNTLLLEFNYYSNGRLPDTPWERNCFFEIQYKLFMIPVALFFTINTIVAAPVFALTITASIITAMLAAVYIYVKCFQKCPIALPNCRNLTLEAALGKLTPTVGREEEIEKLITYLGNLEQDFSLNPLLYGLTGAGKTECICGVAQRIVKGEVPASLKNKQLFMINTAALTSSSFNGFSEKMDQIMLRLKGFENEVIIFFDEVHAAFEKGDGLANFLKSYAVPGGVHCIAATTTEGYQSIKTKDPAFLRRFQGFIINSTDKELTKQILTEKFKPAASHVIIDPEVFDLIIDETSTRMPERAHPSPDINILVQAVNKVMLLLQNQNYVPSAIKKKQNELQALKDKSALSSPNSWRNSTSQLIQQIKKVEGELQRLEADWLEKSKLIKKVKFLVQQMLDKKQEMLLYAHGQQLSAIGNMAFAANFHFLIPELEKEIFKMEQLLGEEFKVKIDKQLVLSIINELLPAKPAAKKSWFNFRSK